MSLQPLRRVRFLFLGSALVAALLAPRRSEASELSWSDGTSRVRVSVEARDYRGASDTLVILVRDYPSQDAQIFEMDARFAMGETREAAAFLMSLAYRDPAALFNQGGRVTTWSVFGARIDELK